MNTLESFYQDLDDLLPYVGKEIVDPESPDGTSIVTQYNSRTREFQLSNSGGNRTVIYYKFEQIVNNLN